MPIPMAKLWIHFLNERESYRWILKIRKYLLDVFHTHIRTPWLCKFQRLSVVQVHQQIKLYPQFLNKNPQTTETGWKTILDLKFMIHSSETFFFSDKNKIKNVFLTNQTHFNFEFHYLIVVNLTWFSFFPLSGKFETFVPDSKKTTNPLQRVKNFNFNGECLKSEVWISINIWFLLSLFGSILWRYLKSTDTE